MWVRLLVITATVLGFTALWTVHVTLPALSLLGLIAWAVLASISSVMLLRRSQAFPNRSE